MKASNVRIKLFSNDWTTDTETRINKWMQENPDNEIHQIQLAVRKACHVMVVYELPESVNESNHYGTQGWQDQLEAYETECRERGKR